MHRQVRRQVGFRIALFGGLTGLCYQLVHRLHDVPAPTVIGGDGQGQAGVAAGEVFGFVDQLDQLGAEARQVTYYAKAHVVFVQFDDLALQRQRKQIHQHRHFLFRAPPVFRAESKQGEVVDTLFGARLDDFAHGFHAAFVPRNARQKAFFRPASIAVHDDGNVARHLRCLGYRCGGTQKERHDAPKPPSGRLLWRRGPYRFLR